MSHTLTRTTAALTLAATAFLGACQGTEADPEPNIVSMQITAGASTVVVPVTGSQTPGPLVLQSGQNTLTVRFLDPSGSVDPVVAQHTQDFTMTVAVPTGWTFANVSRAGGVFTGMLTAESSGTHNITVLLVHEGHEEFKKNVAVTVQ